MASAATTECSPGSCCVEEGASPVFEGEDGVMVDVGWVVLEAESDVIFNVAFLGFRLIKDCKVSRKGISVC